MRIQLAESDRERYGAPEWIEYAVSESGLRTLAALKRDTGYTIDALADALAAAERDEDAYAALAWLALRSIGVRVPWDEFDPLGKGMVVDWGDGEEPGKDEPAPGS